MGIKDRLPGRRPGTGTAEADEADGTTEASGTATSAKPAKPAGKDTTGERSGPDLAVWRTRLAQLVWTLCVLAALVLAIGALLVVIDQVNEDNALVRFVLDTADTIDLGVFSREGGVLTFEGDNAETRNALVNWGLGAIAYLVVGRVLERVVRPTR